MERLVVRLNALVVNKLRIKIYSDIQLYGVKRHANNDAIAAMVLCLPTPEFEYPKIEILINQLFFCLGFNTPSQSILTRKTFSPKCNAVSAPPQRQPVSMQ